MKDKTKIPKIPKKIIPNLEREKEMKKRLVGWSVLLQNLPKCDLVKDASKIYDSFISDNPEMFKDSIFVLKTGANLNHHSTAFIFLYFCFIDDGKRFRIEIDDNAENINDPVANSLQGSWASYKDDSVNSWADGYKLIVKILENAFSLSILEIPKIPDE